MADRFKVGTTVWAPLRGKELAPAKIVARDGDTAYVQYGVDRTESSTQLTVSELRLRVTVLDRIKPLTGVQAAAEHRRGSHG